MSEEQGKAGVEDAVFHLRSFGDVSRSDLDAWARKGTDQEADVRRESVADALSVVDGYGPWGADLNEAHRRQIVLADEVRRLRRLYLSATAGRAEMWAMREERDALEAAPVTVEGGADLSELEELERAASPMPWFHATWGDQVLAGTGSETVLVAMMATNTYKDQGRYNGRLIPALRNRAKEFFAMARRVAWVEANPNHHAMPYPLRGKWIVSAPLNSDDCGYRVFDSWSAAVDAAMGDGKNLGSGAL